MGSDQAEGEAFPPERSPAAHRRGLSFAVAVVVHVLILWGLASSIAFRFVEPPERKSEPKIVALAPRIVPPPPDVERVGPTDVLTTQPRFRPRMPAMARARREGDPALAVWKYLCNRDGSLSEATQRSCPEFHFGDVDLGALDPLNRGGDSGVMLGADSRTMTLEEAAVAKGWIKTPPPKGQTGLAEKTDKSHPDPTERFGPYPWDEGSSKGTTHSWSKDRPEVTPDLN
jgi:hypothetical protein